ncbi:MAG TPA: zinc ribbon domain-containing protein [Gemmataceae bacterium]|nr:zinc ribbon domain-containing protein [Gemmataceae bacterium]
MPIIIYGTRGRTKHLEDGEFYCPQCDARGDYQLMLVRRWVTIFFVPIFPISGGQVYVECRHCGGTFTEDVFDLKEPTPEERYLGKMYDLLLRGRSIESVKKRMMEEGYSDSDAERLLDEVTQGKTWGCVQCGERFLKKFKRCPHCEA